MTKKEKEKVKEIRATLSKSSKKAFDYIVKDWDVDVFAKDFLEIYSLSSEESDKPYYLISWWDSGNCGEFATKEELDSTIRDSLLANDRKSYFNIKVFDVKNEKPLNITNLKISTTYDLEEEC